jgi:hypothetical protein
MDEDLLVPLLDFEFLETETCFPFFKSPLQYTGLGREGLMMFVG